MATYHQFIILGAGPAGLQLAHFLHARQLSYTVLERSDHAGSFFSKFPRHRKLLSINKLYTGRDDPEFNLRHDWNSLLSVDGEVLMREHSADYFPPADALVDYLDRFRKVKGLHVQFDQQVVRVERDESTGLFLLTTATGDVFQCQCLIVATGLGVANVPDIPGIDLATGYEHLSTNPNDYINKSVLIIGKGNSAFETADALVPVTSVLHLISPKPVVLAWNSRYVGHVRAVNNSVLDTYHLKSQNAVIDGHIESIRRSASGKLVVKFGSIHTERETEQLEYDFVLRCTGFRFDRSIYADNCLPAMRSCGRLPLITSGFESVNVPGLFFAGTLMQSLDYRRAQSAFIHGFRYNIRCLAHLLDERYLGRTPPYELVDSSSEALASAILKRMNRVSSLWQQVGFLADLIVMPSKPGDKAQYYHEYPYAYLVEHGSNIAGGADFFITMFRLGHLPDDPFDHPRTTNPFEGEQSTAIHPVLEHFRGGEKQQEFHVLEDFLADWDSPEYRAPIVEFLSCALRGESVRPRPLTDIREIVRNADMRIVSARTGG